ncbi:SAM-dependent methyltransferase [Geomonas limicola]|uniref:SAM-dependent methyltransferase n=1 Tax=Geomonas limicola TaxID=2740186 RepID=A0A6V8N474_9BACT|nr:methyltransferase [Geomonas limicola]GFO66433.1 SAM-dependent methyltransferase [Geomonas limicola]
MEQGSWNIARLLELSGSYWSTCALHAGVKLQVFTPLAAQPMTAAELGGKLELDPRGLAMLLDALSALGLLDKSGDRYVATPFTAQFLNRDSADYLGHIIMHHHHLMDSWIQLDQAVRRGEPVRERVSHGDVAEQRESFLMGMFNLGMQMAPKIVPNLDLAGRRRLLDLGGGPGTYAIHFCQENPDLSAVICDLPTTREFAEQTVERFGLAGRISFVSRDFETDELPAGFDVAWLSHILHSMGPEECAALLRKVMRALDPGGLILVQEFVLDDAKDAPVFPALFSLNMLVGTAGGQSYSEGELVSLLEAAGAREVRRIPLQLPNGSGIIAGVAPNS